MATKPGVKVTRDSAASVIAAIQRLTKLDVLVGVPSNEAERDQGDPLNNAQLAYIHTFGSTIHVPEHETTIYRSLDADGELKNGGQFVKAKKSNYATTHTVPAHDVNIPPRPFLEPGVLAATPKTTPHFKRAAELTLKGDAQGAEKELHSAGLAAQNAVRAVIGSGVHQELAPSTLRARRARGRTGEVPLLDTGEFRNSITYVVRKK